jgi:ABC-type transporter Mla MlaB component
VTIEQRDGQHVTLKIEGKLAGPQVPELHRAWQDLAPSLGNKGLEIDLRGTTHVDGTGRELLAEIHAKTGAEFVADTPLTKYFAQEAQHPVRTISESSGVLRRES